MEIKTANLKRAKISMAWLLKPDGIGTIGWLNPMKHYRKHFLRVQ